ncbi:hypothetical protein [Rugamonas rubra]|uniref:hypothetical protein n=1 Tax=Rugamonas rubra TaxID=758825 RepID=UPI001113F34C|nr:hypothetical protein [Rugamonas rubra]
MLTYQRAQGQISNQKQGLFWMRTTKLTSIRPKVATTIKPWGVRKHTEQKNFSQKRQKGYTPKHVTL